MSVWVLPSDLLARSRFTISPMVETVVALRTLHDPRTPWERAWRRPHVDAYRRLLADPVLRALPDAAFAPRWTADFFSIAPADAAPSFAAELAEVAALDDERIRFDLRRTRPGPLPEVLLSAGLTERVVELLSWVWTQTVRPEWPERDRRLRADIVARTARLSTAGWTGVFADLTGEMRWLGEGRLRVNDYPGPPQSLTEAQELFFIPAHCRKGWVVWEQPYRFGVVYPASGILAQSPPAAPDGLARLIGANRAALLARMDSPLSTSHLVAITGLSLGTVSDHLRVLLDAGAVTKRRSGREVLYWRTALGTALVRTPRRVGSSGPPTPR